VAVIWERWQRVPAAERGGIIVRAYERSAPDRVDGITIAMGVSLNEAIGLGLMPFGVVPTVRKGESIEEHKVRELMLAEGAVETPSGLLLRFPTQESALACYRRLAERTRPEYWAVTEYVQAES
jgi:hypothetical protein